MLNNKIRIADPDRYGRLGQQAKEIMAAYLLAVLTNSRLLTPEYKFLCQKWNMLIDWSKSKFTSSTLEKKLAVFKSRHRSNHIQNGRFLTKKL